VFTEQKLVIAKYSILYMMTSLRNQRILVDRALTTMQAECFSQKPNIRRLYPARPAKKRAEAHPFSWVTWIPPSDSVSR